MAWLSAYLPADQAAGIWDRTTTAARALQGPDEGRTMTQIRADIAATWLLGGDASAGLDAVPSPAAQVLVTVPVFSLLALTDEPATLDRYWPIPPSMANRLLADGASQDKPPGWTSPTGRHYPSEQPDQEPPHWPATLLDPEPGFPDELELAENPELAGVMRTWA
jgi:hypothetical protein